MWNSSAPPPCADQLPDVGAARRDHAIKRRVDLFESLQFFQPLHIGLRGADRGRGGRGLVHEGLRILLRNGIGLDQVLVAFRLGAARCWRWLRTVARSAWACASC